MEALEFKSTKEFEKWLGRNHANSNGIWIRLFKKGSGIQSLSASEAVDVCLCFGWISGRAARGGGNSWLGWFGPRRPRSLWSRLNTERAEKLLREGRMMPAGLEEMERAKRDGRWERAYAPPSRGKIPDDFAAELKKSPKAEAFFKTLNRANVYAIIWRLETARRADLRSRKISAMIRMLEKGETFH